MGEPSRFFTMTVKSLKNVGTSASRHKTRCRPQPWPIRLIACVLILVEVLLPAHAQLLAAAEVLLAPPTTISSASHAPGPVLTPTNVVVNKTAPKVDPPPAWPQFSARPTESEIFRARVFAEPLVPIGAPPAAEENSALAQALLAFLNRSSNDDVSAVTQFLEQHPDSAWRAALLTDLGIIYRRTGYFSKALSAWEEAWSLSKSASAPNAVAIADRAVGELAELNARLGRYDVLRTLFAQIDGRMLSGPATEKIAGARQGLWLMQNRPELAFRCGPMALDRIRASSSLAEDAGGKIRESKSSLQGMSLVEVCALANELGMNYRMARRDPGASILFPAVVHWKVGHYAAVVRTENGQYYVQDPTFGDDIWVSPAALEAEASGYFLVPAGPLPNGWRAVTTEEGAMVWGKGNTTASDKNCTKPCDKKVPPCKDCHGMAAYAFHTMLVSLNMMDSPVGYAPPRGYSVGFTATYNQREANQPSIFTYSNLGPKWTFDWLAYITDNPLNASANVDYFVAGGGTEPNTGYNSATQSYAPQVESRAVVVRTSSTSYERRLPDGSKQIFNLPDGATAYPRKVFLTQVVDPLGNTNSYTYDASFRLVSVADALGQVTTLSYDLSADSLKITKVTDPFGRFATFDYAQLAGVWRLVKITDVIGLSSQFTYSGDFIDSLATPYGMTTFAYGEQGRTFWLEATDPLGQKERLEYDNYIYAVDNNPLGVPAGISNGGGYIGYRNSFYWDKKAMQLYPGDYTKARTYHWLHTQDMNQTSGILESEKDPLESRVWYNYSGQASGYYAGTNAQPTAVGRIIDGGATQLSKFEYNSLGRITKATDPAGRIATSTYETNLIDLLEVRQQIGTNAELLSKFTYNAQHLPLTVVDAAGQTTFFGYNAYGQLTVVTNARNETVSMSYDTNGYLTNILGSLPGATTSLTYDGYGRVRTVTDSEGFTVTTDYDAFDRPTKITYPDATYAQIVYKFLDPIAARDRRGHWSSKTYDPLRRLTDVRDALNRVTHFEWCNCGSLESITDALNHTTTWLRDLQGRVTTKLYPDTTQINYTYETNSSRLRKMTDAKNQSTVYDYYADNNLKHVTYTNASVATPSVSFTYDTNYNRVLTMVDGNGTNTYSYYAVTNGQLGAGKLLSLDGPWNNDTISYAYDELGRVKSQAINGVAQTASFDALGRVTVVTNALGSFTNEYVGVTGRIATNYYPNGQKTVFSYYGATNDFRLEQIQNLSPSAQNLSTFSYTYDADGQIATWTQQADANTPTVWVTEYDPVDQLLAVTVRSNSVTGTILKQYVYGYDKSGNRTSEQIQSGAGVPPAISSATHNNANQLTSTSGGGALRFRGSLDELGTVTVAGSSAAVDSETTNFVAYAEVSSGTNIVPVVGTDYSNNSRTNQYQIIVTNNSVAKTLTYDLNGNLASVVTGTSTNTYEWDAADRLTATESRTGVSPVTRSEFSYDGYGRRTQIVEKQNASVVSTQKFLWRGTALSEERDSTGGTVTKRYFGQGQINYQPSTINLFYTRDHLGSVREMTDNTGSIRARYEYDPYGRVTQISGDLASDFRYTGHYFHPISGMYLPVFRAYDPEAGRWISRDPIQEEGGLNLYAYVGNSPLDATDRLGLVMNPIQQQLLSEALNQAGSITTLKELKKINKDTYYDPKTGKGFRVDLGDKAHLFPHVHVFDSKAAIKKNITASVLIYDINLGAIRRAVKSLALVGGILALATASASAENIACDLRNFVYDKKTGKDDWAYVDALSVRHELNQHGFFAGDIAMRAMYKGSE
jgi:RHS repeat-associated protein